METVKKLKTLECFSILDHVNFGFHQENVLHHEVSLIPDQLRQILLDSIKCQRTIHYLSGKVTGDMALETIGLGHLIVPNQVIGIAKVVEIPLLDISQSN